MNSQDILIIGIILFLLGLGLSLLGKFSFKIRAIANKKAWGGSTLPMMIIGIITTLISLIFIYIGYPK